MSYKIDDTLFITTVQSSKNICQTLKKLGLSFRGGAYTVFKSRCEALNLDITHFISDKQIRSSISEEAIRAAISKTESRMDCLKNLDLNPETNANVNWILHKISQFNCDITHWKGLGHLKGKTHSWSKKKDLSEIMVANCNYNSHNLKRRLISENLLDPKCFRCDLVEWQGEKLSLHLEHKNGNHLDNRLENLALLCPNCHSLTPTYCRKKSAFDSKPDLKTYNPISVISQFHCVDCNKSISQGCLRCKSCAAKLRPTKICWPSNDELIQMLSVSNYSAVAKILGVSDNAIRKRLRK